MKKYFEKRLKYLNLTLLFMFFLAISFAGSVRVNQKNELEFRRKISKIWAEAVRTDCYERFEEANELFVQGETASDSLSSTFLIQTKDTTVIMDKDSSLFHEDKAIKHENVLQSILLDINPVEMNRLDSLFLCLLEKENLSNLKVFSHYYDSKKKLVKHSEIDTSLCAKAITTNDIKAGMSGEISLRGYVVVPSFYFIKSAKQFYISWVLLVICISLIFWYLVRQMQVAKKLEQTLPEISFTKEEIVENNLPEPSSEIFYDSTTRTLTYGNQSVGLTSLSGLLFLSLLQSPNHSLPYETIISVLWSDENGDKGRLEQHCYTLRKKLKEISDFDISVETISGVGYALHIPEGVEICLK